MMINAFPSLARPPPTRRLPTLLLAWGLGCALAILPTLAAFAMEPATAPAKAAKVKVHSQAKAKARGKAKSPGKAAKAHAAARHAHASPGGALDPAAVRAFSEEVARRHGLDAGDLERLFAQVQRNDRILALISRPAEGKPWYVYRRIFLTPERIRAGRQFLAAHGEAMRRAEAEYGVPGAVIAAIIGVETFFGRNMGQFGVLEALATLAFHYPKRAEFFRKELERFLLLARAEGWAPLTPKGSYTGAMGYGQFMPSSYENFAVDFDGDGRRDLRGSIPDAIGSVANYLRRHGWEPGQPVAAAAQLGPRANLAAVPHGLEPSWTLGQLREAGVEAASTGPDLATTATTARAAFVDLEDEDGRAYWLGFQNFYAITRYNHSALYALAVWQLANEIRSASAVAERP